MEFLPYLLSICLYVSSTVLNRHVCRGGTMGYILGVFCLWPIHQQFLYLVFVTWALILYIISVYIQNWICVTISERIVLS